MSTVTITLAWWLILPVALTALIVIGAMWLWCGARHQPEPNESARVLAILASFFITLGWALVLYGRWTA